MFLRDNGAIILALGTGVAFGATAVVVLHRQLTLSEKIAQDLACLSAKLDNLRRDVQELKSALCGGKASAEKEKSRQTASGYYSVHASSGEEDTDVFEEAYGSEQWESFQDNSSDYLSLSSGTTNASSPLSLDDLITQVDGLLDGTDIQKERAYAILKSQQHNFYENASFVWRYAKSIFGMSQIAAGRGDDEIMKRLVYKAQEVATHALQINPNSSDVHKWYAITLGKIGDFEGASVKIKNGYTFKTHIERTLELNPKDHAAHYLLGRWCYGVYMLTWIERQLASTLFAKPPSSTVEEALTHFMEAERLKPNSWKENMLFIAKCHIEKYQYTEAVTWLDKANKVPTISQDDKLAQKEVESLLWKYSGYRS